MDTIVRDKLRVFEAMYNVISESSEWAYNSGNDYIYFIEGVVAMTREQIKEIDERLIDVSWNNDITTKFQTTLNIYATKKDNCVKIFNIIIVLLFLA